MGTTTATVSPSGSITNVTLPTLFYHESPNATDTGTTETIIVSQLTPGTASGSIAFTGAVSLEAALKILVTIHHPLPLQCTTKPVVVLKSSVTSPYNPSSENAVLTDGTFAIPNFASTGCGPAVSTLNSRFAGSSGNTLTFGIHGALPLPPPPAASTTTSLTVSPAGSAVAGQTVTLTATISSATTAGTLNAGATITFMSGNTALAAPKAMALGKATLKTSSLAVVPNQRLSAVYSGNGTYATSTSTPVTYVVKPAPTVTATLPATVKGGTATPTLFTLTITNPASGLAYSQLYGRVELSNMRGLTSTSVVLQYEDSSGGWCSLPGFTGSTFIYGLIVGVGSSCTPTYPASFSMAAPSALTVHFRIAYPTPGFYGYQKVTVKLFTGTCTAGTITTCTPVAPLSGSAAPTGSGGFEVLPPSPIASKLTDFAARKATSTVHKTFNVALQTQAGPVTAGSGLSGPTGTVSYAVDGATVATSTLEVSGAAASNTPLVLYNTSGLTVGKHTLVSTYSGDQVYAPSTLTETFTVTAAPSGAPFTCVVAGTGGGTLPAYVKASGTVASPVTFATSTTTVPVSNATVTLDIDPANFASLYNASQTSGALGFSPVGSSAITAKKITFTGTTNTLPDVIGTWTKLTTTAPITVKVPVAKGTPPGTRIAIGASSMAFDASIYAWSCTPTSSAAPITTVTVAGTTIAATPSGVIPAGQVVTLKASVFPAATSSGTVSFTDVVGGGSTDVGTASVKTGVATLPITPAAGAHSYVATWSGSLSVPKNTLANPANVTADVAPAVTTQPSPPSANLGKPLIFTAAATGTPAPTATWQMSTNGGSTWTTASGTVTTTVTGTTTTTTLTIPSATKTDNDTQFRVVFANPLTTVASNAVTPTVVIPPAVTTQPQNQAVVAGGAGTFSAAATGSVLAVQWQVSTDGGSTWSNAPGTPVNTFASRTTLSSTYTTPPTTTVDNGAQYRAHFSNGAGTANSNPATLTVTPAPVAPTVTTQPTGDTVNAGTTAVFYAASSGLPAPSVQWQQSTNGGNSWATVPGATSDPLVVPSAPGTSSGNLYRAVFTNSAGTATTNPAALTVNVDGYHLVAKTGSVYSYGDAPFYGSMGGKTLSAPIVGTATTPGDGGYWLVGSDGGIFSFGDAAFYGSTGGMTLNKPVVGMAATPDGKGYWLVASDGGIFAYGDAAFYGSTGSMALNKPIVGMASTPTGGGYWLVASDGGVFSFGNAPFYGTVAGTTSDTIVSITPTPDGGGYWETASNGQVFQFGDATSAGTAIAQTATIVAMSD